MRRVVRASACVMACLTSSCGGNDDSSPLAGHNGTATVQMKADFGTAAVSMGALRTAAARSLSRRASLPAAKQAVCPTPATTQDGPNYAAGLDCDHDGGVVSYLTPSEFRVSIKRLSFIKDDNTKVDIMADSGTLAAAPLVDLTSTFTLPAQTLPAGAYPQAQFEFYFVELQMPINNPDETARLRIYLSDDDLPSEGILGHHQGDITFVDATSGVESGFVKPGERWSATNLSSSRTMIYNSVDPETGHYRGLFGDTVLWDRLAFMQGASEDLFVYDMPLGVEVPADGNPTVTVAFPVKDSWYWEDFDGDGEFGPCLGTPPHSDACAEGAEWAPLFNPPQLAAP